MIVFDLNCKNGHRFEGWFSSSEDFDRQAGSKRIVCPLCGNANVSRLPNAPHIRSAAREPAASRQAPSPGQHYANLGGEVLTRVIEQIIEKTVDVGPAFPEEARKIHYREAPDRRIRGTATREEVEALKDEGIEVVALPLPAHLLGKTH